MLTRNIKANLQMGLKRSPVVLLMGARQTGKTTLAKEIGGEQGYHYVTFDDIRFLTSAKNDPIGFIRGLKKPVILDEVQRVPELFLSIKQDVDENRLPGMFLLTGSANPLLLPKLGDSLAGRIEIFTMFPLSQGEISGHQEQFIDMVFNGHIPKSGERADKQDLYRRISVGGYPLVQKSDYPAREAWFNSYITTLLQRDVKDLSQIAGLADFPLLLNLLATRSANLLNVSELSRTSGISSTTLHRYLTLLETLFIINFQPPWSFNLGKRLVKSPKINFIDTGLLSFLLGINLEEAIEPRVTGPVLENFVVGELYKQASWSKTRVRIYHLRTTAGIEVDVVLENAAGKLVGIEVKNSATPLPQDFKGLKQLENLAGNTFVAGFVLYSGVEQIPFGNKFAALPMSSLWGSV